MQNPIFSYILNINKPRKTGFYSIFYIFTKDKLLII